MRWLSCAVVLLALLGFPGCAAPEQSEPSETGSFVRAEWKNTEFHAEAAQSGNGAQIDVSSATQGYVGVRAQSEKRLKVKVGQGESVYVYDLPGDGTPQFFPLQCGDGLYKIQVMQNTTESKYIELFAVETQVNLEDEFQPFLHANQIVWYTQESECVSLANQLGEQASSETDAVARIYEYIKENIVYDYDKAAGDVTGYVPDPDQTLSSGKGICFDYASLAAAMLRSQGIPAKVITGYVSGGAVYHAWNMIYLKESGWITVEIKAPANEWERIDLTFAANGADETTIGDGTDYVDRYVY